MGHLAQGPPEFGDGAGSLPKKLAVVLVEGCQDHLSTSLPDTSMAPCFMTARKNMGVMSSGLR